MANIIDLNGLLKVSHNGFTDVPKTAENSETSVAFSNVLDSAMSLLNDTNKLSNDAQAAAIDFALGKTDSTHEMTIALQKAAVSLQYVVAIKNQLMSAYKEIMQMQI